MSTYQKHLFSLACASFLIFISCNNPESITIRNVDVCVYGGTASGIMAAVAASRQGYQVLVVEPSRWLGGMTGGGISHIDWGNEVAVGGTTLEILKNEFNNAQYRQYFEELINKHKVNVVYEHRLAEVRKSGTLINTIVLDYAPPDSLGCPLPQPSISNALVINAKVFIDCSYEGDLMAKSGVSYTYGRESRDEYDESLAGVQPALTTYDIDPYRIPGDPASGLLHFLQDRQIGPVGAADNLSMGYCLRYKFELTGSGIPIPEPDSYNPDHFEMFRRGFNAGLDLSQAKKIKKLGKIKIKEGYFISSNGSGNTNRSLLTTTIWGSNSEYPDGDWAMRAGIWKFHQDYFKGIIHFLRNDPSVPELLRELSDRTTFSREIFDDTGGWPHQLYVREGRRLISDYVLTQHDIEGHTDPAHPIGLASYGVDEWPYATVPVDGKIAIVGGGYSELILNSEDAGVYKIPYESITPRVEECENLLVPVCCSASHIAMTSIRMEPVWMVLGESAGIAAALALENGIAVQKVDYAQLLSRLLSVGQKVELP